MSCRSTKGLILFCGTCAVLLVLAGFHQHSSYLLSSFHRTHSELEGPPAPAKNRTMRNRSGRHSLPGNETTNATICSCGGWQEWVMRGKPTPPCCLRQTAETVWNFVDFFEHENVTYSPHAGALLGALRCGSLSSYEYDYDIILYGYTQDTVKPLMQRWMQRENEPGGLLRRWGVTVGGLKFIGNGWGDFNRRTPRGDVHFDFGVTPEPAPPAGLRPCSLYGRMLTCTSGAVAVLDEKYGRDWMTPRRWCKWPTKLCDRRDEIEHRACAEARQEMREGPMCERHPNLFVGTVGCNGSDTEEVLNVSAIR